MSSLTASDGVGEGPGIAGLRYREQMVAYGSSLPSGTKYRKR